MKLHRDIALTVLALVAASASVAQEPLSGTDTETDRLAIIRLLENGPMGIETDFEAWSAEYHPDWTVWFAGQPEARAKAEHMALVRDYIDGGARVLSYEADFVHIEVRGHTALARFNTTETLREADGSTRVARFASSDMLLKEDGEWRVLTTSIAFLPEDEG